MISIRSILSHIKCTRFFSTSSRSCQEIMNVFDRKSKYLQRERAYFSENVGLYDYLKDEIGSRLADRIFDINRKFKCVANVGCGRGHVSKNITEDCVECLHLLDQSDRALSQVALPEEGVKVTKRICDEEELDLGEETYDLVISSLALHWVNNLPGAFGRVQKCLKKDGAFLGAVFGGDTLYELRSSLQLAGVERAGGVSSHVSPFADVRDIGGLLNQAGFTLLTIDTDEIIVGYPSMFHLMDDLKGMGENNCSWRRCAHLRRDVAVAANSIYEALYTSGDKEDKRGVPATFQVIYFVGWKPDPSQPKPAERGSATHSLKQLDEVAR